jgi:hypothetical protein
VFQRLYSRIGRPSIALEKLIRASVLQMLYTIRSERQLMEQLNFNILYSWFVGLGMDDKVWDATVYTKNRARLLRGQVDVRFFEAILEQARENGPRSRKPACARTRASSLASSSPIRCAAVASRSRSSGSRGTLTSRSASLAWASDHAPLAKAARPCWRACDPVIVVSCGTTPASSTRPGGAAGPRPLPARPTVKARASRTDAP